jgi:hypothetical protein
LPTAVNERCTCSTRFLATSLTGHAPECPTAVNEPSDPRNAITVYGTADDGVALHCTCGWEASLPYGDTTLDRINQLIEEHFHDA